MHHEEGGGGQVEGEGWRFDQASHRVIVQAQHGVARPVNLPEARVRQLEHLFAHVAHLAKEPEHVVRLAELVALPDQQTHLALKVHERLEARDPLRKLKLREGQQEAIITASACGVGGRSRRGPVATGTQASGTAHEEGQRPQAQQAATLYPCQLLHAAAR